jgi:hypothetical protein
MCSGFLGTGYPDGFRVPENGEPAYDTGFPGSWEPGTRLGTPFLGTRNPPGYPVPGNPEPILNLYEKIVIDYINIPLCFEMRKNEL